MTPIGDSVLLSFILKQWRTSWPPREFLLGGDKESVDTRFNQSIGVDEESPNLWEALGGGLYDSGYVGGPSGWGAYFYRDVEGVRLIALESPTTSCDTLILSSESRHAAGLVKEHLVGLQTESGIGLGDSRERVVGRLGDPSDQHAFGDYAILWYLGRPERLARDGKRHRVRGASAYALRDERVVEIWMHRWEAGRLEEEPGLGW